MGLSYDSYRNKLKDKLKTLNVEYDNLYVEQLKPYKWFNLNVTMNDFVDMKLDVNEQDNEYNVLIDFNRLTKRSNIRRAITKKFGYKEYAIFWGEHCNITIPEFVISNGIDIKNNHVEVYCKYGWDDPNLKVPHNTYLWVSKRGNSKDVRIELLHDRGPCGVRFSNIKGFDKVIELLQQVVTNISNYLLEITNFNEDSYSDGLDKA